MGLDLDAKIDLNAPLETEHGINLDHPMVLLMRKHGLEKRAGEQGSDLKCPRCTCLMPHSDMHSPRPYEKEDGSTGLKAYCSICDDSFDYEPK